MTLWILALLGALFALVGRTRSTRLIAGVFLFLGVVVASQWDVAQAAGDFVGTLVIEIR